MQLSESPLFTEVTVISVVPAARAVMFPLASIVATFGLELFHVRAGLVAAAAAG